MAVKEEYMKKIIILLLVAGMLFLTLCCHKKSSTGKDKNLTYSTSLLWTEVNEVKVKGSIAYCTFGPGIVALVTSPHS